jgi:formylglycine-generating enzyme required for sulfatase activity
MQDLKLNKSKFKKLILIVACLIGLAVLTNGVTGQVVIVPNKLRPSRTNGKTKTKSKPKPDGSPVPAPAPDPASNSLAFAVFPPATLKNTEAPAAALNAGAPGKLLEFAFTAVMSDARGKVAETRREFVRYFVEELAGGVELEMVEVPGGMFSMGLAEDDIAQVKKEFGRGIEKEIREKLVERLRWETPGHPVKLPAFYLGKYEVTQAQWRAVASLPKVKMDLMSDPSHFKGGNRPVENVSWEEAVEFCERLSRATGRRFRLPTEAEWEYACRAGAATPFHFGESVISDWANYHGKYPYAGAPKGDNRQQTIPAGSLGVANAFGLYDMHGNVWEWCLDSWHDSYVSSPGDGRSWEEDGIGYLKVLRGGGWDSPAGECRASSRNKMTSSLRLNNIGFRVVAEGISQ